MGMQGGQDGVAAFMEYNFVAAAGGQSKFVGADKNGFVLNYATSYLWAIVDGFWVSAEDFTATDGSSITFTAPVDASTAVRLIALAPFTIADTYARAASDASFAKRRNRIIDPGMRVSQEQGNNLLTVPTNGSIYPSDSFPIYRVGSTGGMQVQRIALATPGGSPYRVRVTVTGVNASPAAGDLAIIYHRNEGLDVADLKLGTTSAKLLAVRFGCRVSVSGDYAVSIGNSQSAVRNWLGKITIAPAEVGLDVVKTVFVPGDQIGTWATDNTTGLQFSICLCCGSNFQGVAGWQGANVYATVGTVNLMATNGATFDIFDVGLYDVTGLSNGVIPPFELGGYAEDLQKCLRYYELVRCTPIQTAYIQFPYQVLKRAEPSLSLYSGGLNGASTRSVDQRAIRCDTPSNGPIDAFIAANARL